MTPPSPPTRAVTNSSEGDKGRRKGLLLGGAPADEAALIMAHSLAVATDHLHSGVLRLIRFVESGTYREDEALELCRSQLAKVHPLIADVIPGGLAPGDSWVERLLAARCESSMRACQRADLLGTYRAYLRGDIEVKVAFIGGLPARALLRSTARSIEMAAAEAALEWRAALENLLALRAPDHDGRCVYTLHPCSRGFMLRWTESIKPGEEVPAWECARLLPAPSAPPPATANSS